MHTRHLFNTHLAQTSPAPLALHIIKASGTSLWDMSGKEYIDLIGGISVCNIGHAHPKVVEAIQKQAKEYLHIMVYGELVQSPQVDYATMLTSHLPKSLNSVFFTASGSEATEGAMKLAKRATGRTEIISFKNSYHGSTQGALSIMGSEYWQQAYRPLLPDIKQLHYNNIDDLEWITEKTAAVFAETIQAEAGVLKPTDGWLKKLAEKCKQKGALLVLDEIQCGFGRNGTLWAFEQFDVVPDILLLGKALGGGMPLGAFIADKKLMDLFTHNPVLGHINTFGGHPVCCAAGLAALDVLLHEIGFEQISQKENLFHEKLQHATIRKINSAGLMMAVHFDDFETNKRIIDQLVLGPDNEVGVFTDWFLFADNALRIVPPLNIEEEKIEMACEKIIQVLDKTLA